MSGVEPAAFWRHFEAITKVARPSRHEEAMIEHVRAWAATHDLEVKQDAGRNLVMSVAATPGRESAPTVILQGHLDMVCERQPDSPNDPTEGRIALLRDGEWLTADGTTLGADDGVAIAAMMTLVDDPSLPHGPLELLMTVAEEVGLEGANNLDGSLLSGSILLNLDSEEDGKLTVGCAGSTDTWVRIARPQAAVGADYVTLDVRVTGGLGGHSGANIADGRSNAVKVLGRVLRVGHQATRFRLASLDGGKSRNAIPRDAHAVIAVPQPDEAELLAALATATAVIRDDYVTTDPDVNVLVTRAKAPVEKAWSEADTQTLLDAVAVVPTGPLAMSPDFDGLVETSTSLGEAVTDGETLTLHSLSRSSNDSALPAVIATLDAAADLAGGELEVKPNYAGWRPDLESPTLAAAIEVYRSRLEAEPIVTGVHAGLESAVIGSKVTGLDMLAIGPEIQFPHSPDERVSIPTVERFWTLLTGLLDELSQPGLSR